MIAVLQQWYDPRCAEPWDAVGLVCGDPDERIERVVFAVDALPETVGEAQAVGAQLLLTHHPLLLTGVHGVPTTDPKGALVHRMIRSGIAHFVAHTNADVATPGVSDALGDVFGLREMRPLERAAETAPACAGTGRVGELSTPLSLCEFTAHAASVLPATAWGVRAAGDPDRVIRTVAVCGGSGGSLAETARQAGADVLLTADLKHHSTLEAVNERGSEGIALVDAAHWATEAPWLDALAPRLTEQFGTSLDVRVSRIVTDPWTLHAHSS